MVALGSDSLAGSPASALDPRLNGHLPAFLSNEEALAVGADVVFSCLDHERAVKGQEHTFGGISMPRLCAAGSPERWRP